MGSVPSHSAHVCEIFDRWTKKLDFSIGIPPLVDMDDKTLARWLKPVLTHYLTDPAPGSLA